MIDAEQTYMQPAIDHIVMQLQRKYNTGPTPVVFNTYQVPAARQTSPPTLGLTPCTAVVPCGAVSCPRRTSPTAKSDCWWT